MLLILMTLISGSYNYLTNWPRITQSYRPGTCLVSENTSEEFLVVGFTDIQYSPGPPARIIKANRYAQHKPGDIIYIVDGDKHLKKINCEQK